MRGGAAVSFEVGEKAVDGLVSIDGTRYAYADITTLSVRAVDRRKLGWILALAIGVPMLLVAVALASGGTFPTY
jgi:hypothetical protein